MQTNLEQAIEIIRALPVENMAENKSSVSKAGSYQKIGEYWDTHDLGEVWDNTEDAEFEVDLKSDVFYYAKETIYDAKTVFPKNFNPNQNGLTRIKSPIE